MPPGGAQGRVVSEFTPDADAFPGQLPQGYKLVGIERPAGAGPPQPDSVPPSGAQPRQPPTVGPYPGQMAPPSGFAMTGAGPMTMGHAAGGGAAQYGDDGADGLDL